MSKNECEIRKINKANAKSKTSKLTLPKAYCDKLNISPGDKVKIELEEKKIIITKLEL